MMKKPNEQARALFHRAGTANVAVAIDTRPKTLRDRKVYRRTGRDAQRVRMADIRSGRFD